MTKNEDNSDSLLLECIDRLMPIALQITFEKNKEPTFYNVLDIISSHCNDWFLVLKSTGTFVQLSTGWMYVRLTNILITDNTVMDDAVLHSLRSLSSFVNGVSLVDLCSYISAAFRFPKALSSQQITEMVQCSTNSMKVWGKVSIDNGHYKLAEEALTAGSQAAVVTTVEPTPSEMSETPLAVTSDAQVPAKYEAQVKRDTGAKLVSEFAVKNMVLKKEVREEIIAPKSDSDMIANFLENNAERTHAVLDPDQVSITSTAGSPQPSVAQPDLAQTSSKDKQLDAGDTTIGVPFLFASGYYKLFVLHIVRTKLKAHWNNFEAVRAVFEETRLPYVAIHLAPNSNVVFVEIRELEVGIRAIKLLNHSYRDNGAFKLIVHWARPSSKDFAMRDYYLNDKLAQRTVAGRRDVRASSDTRKHRSLSREKPSIPVPSPRRTSPYRPDVRSRRSASPAHQRPKRSRSRSSSPRHGGYHSSSRPTPVPDHPDRDYSRSPHHGYSRCHSSAAYQSYIAPIERSPFEKEKARWQNGARNTPEQSVDPYRLEDRQDGRQPKRYAVSGYGRSERR
ncbi:hypothetical protein RvY_11631 [Ramazzottius varieornatus]|uniref:Uncharacterized protein n=1 Tax=Ramazzottius varieornatus TaxID=947166 RepID=A0A1D1VGQ6_RAMVA|nr:hypothetical protein RvY_11631 [Ramazzottius varieornatus]